MKLNTDDRLEKVHDWFETFHWTVQSCQVFVSFGMFCFCAIAGAYVVANLARDSSHQSGPNQN